MSRGRGHGRGYGRQRPSRGELEARRAERMARIERETTRHLDNIINSLLGPIAPVRPYLIQPLKFAILTRPVARPRAGRPTSCGASSSTFWTATSQCSKPIDRHASGPRESRSAAECSTSCIFQEHAADIKNQPFSTRGAAVPRTSRLLSINEHSCTMRYRIGGVHAELTRAACCGKNGRLCR
jgi:hypothetical protein